ncbi:hypothetical protein TNCV_2529602 [Trichonephila clavipes]|nr:hypothetical protein TNCV_2529602 [Trichonephila clavipes]
MENYAEFLSKEFPDIKIDDNCLFEVERRLNVHLNSNKLEQLENQHAEKLATYEPNKQAKEEVACVGLNRNLEQPLQHVGVHYPAER